MNYLALLILSLSLHPIVLAKETISYILSTGSVWKKEKWEEEQGEWL